MEHVGIVALICIRALIVSPGKYEEVIAAHEEALNRTVRELYAKNGNKDAADILYGKYVPTVRFFSFCLRDCSSLICRKVNGGCVSPFPINVYQVLQAAYLTNHMELADGKWGLYGLKLKQVFCLRVSRPHHRTHRSTQVMVIGYVVDVISAPTMLWLTISDHKHICKIRIIPTIPSRPSPVDPEVQPIRRVYSFGVSVFSPGLTAYQPRKLCQSGRHFGAEQQSLLFRADSGGVLYASRSQFRPPCQAHNYDRRLCRGREPRHP